MQLSTNFKNDIQGRDTNLVPVVWIGTLSSTGNYVGEQYWLSTNSMTIAGGNTNTLPILSNIPSIKESIDIEKRNYRISNVTIQLSNYEYNGVRFSELVGESSLINTECRIFWKSPATDNPRPLDHPLFSEIMFDNDLFEIYYGVIRRYEHDDDKVKLVVEDRSQSKLHRDLPKILSDDDSIPDKYKLKPIPMVYGYVPKSPTVISYSPEYGETYVEGASIKLLLDKDDTVQLLNDPNNTITEWQPTKADFFNPDLFIYDDTYIPVAKIISKTIHYGLFYGDGINDVTQYRADGNTIVLGREGGYVVPYGEAGAGPTDLVGKNKIFLYERVRPNPTSIEPTRTQTTDGNRWFCTNSITQVTPQGYMVISGTVCREGAAGGIGQNPATCTDVYCETGGWYTGQPAHFFTHDDIHFELSEDHVSELICDAWVKLPSYAGDIIENESSFMTSDVDVHIFRTGGSPDGYHIAYFFAGNVKKYAELPVTGERIGDQYVWYEGEYDGENHPNTANNFSSIKNYNFGLETTTASYPLGLPVDADKMRFGYQTYHAYVGEQKFGVQIVIKEAFVDHYMVAKGFNKLDVFANVSGRKTHLGAVLETAPEVINHIMKYELGQTTGTAPTEYDEWKYAFTVHKKINSKKLVEEISSASPFIPRFNNMGEWKFDVIKSAYARIDINDSRRIKKDEVISFSYSRSKIESVKSRVLFKYNWDYGREEFMDSVNNGAGYTVNQVLPPNNTYDYSYYGLMNEDGNATDADSTLEIDSKYIRDDTPMTDSDGNVTFPGTATAYAKWMLALNCNTHLKIKLRLPLNYLDIEVGSLISFDEVIGNAHPYNIDYSAGTAVSNDEIYDGASFYKEGDDEEVDSPYIGQLINGQQVFPLFMFISPNKSISYVDIEVYQLHNLLTSDIKDDDILGVTDQNAWNYNEGATIDYAPGIYGNDFLVPFCPIKYDPFGATGDEDTLDYSTNFPVEPLDAFFEPIGPEGFDADGNIVTNGNTGVFVITEWSALADKHIGNLAYMWWLDEANPDPVIYYTGNCEWTDFIKHYSLSG